MGLDSPTFAVFSVLRARWPEEAVGLASKIARLRNRFPNAGASADEFRQLKGELYKILLRVASGTEMVRLGEQILELLRVSTN
jgi:hypothetical protein